MKWNFTIRVKKTADDMFRELGYGKVWETASIIIYENIDNSFCGDCIVHRIYVKFPGGKYFKNALFDKTINNYEQQVEFNYKEILACAQLIKEMEADNGI